MAFTRSWASKRVGVRYLRAADLVDVARMLARESVCEHLFFGPNTPQETQTYFAPLLKDMEGYLSRSRLPRAPLFALLHPQGGQFIGQAALLPVAFAEGNWALGYQLDEPFWGQGFATWAARFLVQHAFVSMGARRVSAECFASNRASARVLVKAGFQPEGVQRAHYPTEAGAVDNLLFGVVRGDLEGTTLAEWREAFLPTAR